MPDNTSNNQVNNATNSNPTNVAVDTMSASLWRIVTKGLNHIVHCCGCTPILCERLTLVNKHDSHVCNECRNFATPRVPTMANHCCYCVDRCERSKECGEFLKHAARRGNSCRETNLHLSIIDTTLEIYNNRAQLITQEAGRTLTDSDIEEIRRVATAVTYTSRNATTTTQTSSAGAHNLVLDPNYTYTVPTLTTIHSTPSTVGVSHYLDIMASKEDVKKLQDMLSVLVAEVHTIRTELEVYKAALLQALKKE